MLAEGLRGPGPTPSPLIALDYVFLVPRKADQVTNLAAQMNAEARLRELAATLPDRPRLVEARGLLLSGRCDVILGPEGRTTGGFLVVEHERPLVCAVERPGAAPIAEMLAEYPEHGELLAPMEHAEHLRSLLPGWVARPATIHVHPSPGSLPGPRHEVRFLGKGDESLWDALPLRFAHELSLAVEVAPAVATIVEGRVAAFCYAAYETEAWWDVSVGTAPEHRRRGYASSAAAFLIRHMLERGKQPVWGALDANQASLAMAAKYGFRAVDRMVVFSPRGKDAASG